MTDQLFFKPWVGRNYLEGYSGAKILVLGASHYCTNRKCKNFDRCTSSIDGARECNDDCPDYIGKKSRNKLSYTTINEISNYFEEHYNSYHRFTRWVLGHRVEGVNDKKKVWESIAFSNIFQYPLPDTYTPKGIIENFKEIIEAIIDSKRLPDYPDIIIIWGSILRDNFYELMNQKLFEIKPIRNHNQLFRWENVNDEDIVVYIMTHPSSPKFFTLEDRKTLDKAISLSRR